ncbi:PQQ-binding-like beta-propeller repeat protein [Actinoplanes sp. NPDC023801]|uniref:outer membrane protein assembly factor BamB family protein n=1 Tax=Actinoplanes sp. NPDC023801 TaxID=3154595 RepID=UPI0033D3E736
MAGPADDATQPPEATQPVSPPPGVRYATGVSEAATPTPTPATVEESPRTPVDPRDAPTRPKIENPPAPVDPRDAPTKPEIEYADPVDPWAAAEAAAIAAGGQPGGYTAHPHPESTWTVPGAGGPASGPASEPAAAKPAPARKWLLIGGAATTVAAVAVAATVYFWPGYPALDYHRVELIKQITPAVPIASSFTDSEVLGDRAYFASAGSDGRLHVVAADTGSGDKPLWESDAAGQATTWDRMIATPSALLLFSGIDSSTSTSRMAVLDPKDGKLLWERRLGYNDDVIPGDKALVVSDREGKRLLGLGWRDGGPKWTQADPDATAIAPVLTPKNLTGPAGSTGRPFAPDLADDGRFVQFDADRMVTVRDVDSGDSLQTRANVASSSDKTVAYDGRLYVLETGTPKRILEYDLADLAKEPRIVHNADAKDDVKWLGPCGKLLCLIQNPGYEAAEAKVVAVGGEGAWSLQVPKAERLVPVGDTGVLAIGDEGTTLIVDGRQVWSDTTLAVRLDAGNVLRFSEDLTTSVSDRTLSGFHVGDEPGQISELGQVLDVRSDSCSWNTSVLACAAEEKYVVYSFAG